MYEKILVPLDGSELAEVALPYAEELTSRLKTEVILFLVVPRAYNSYAAYGAVSQIPYSDEEMGPIKAGAQGYLEKVGNKLKDKGIATRAEVGIGAAADEIIKLAEKNSVDMVTMSTHGRSGISRWALGSVADKVVRGTKKPVALIRAKGTRPDVREKGILNKVLVPLDGSKEGEAVIPYIEDLASRLEAEVILLQVLSTSYQAITAEGYGYVIYPEQQIESDKGFARDYLDEIGTRLKQKDMTVKSEVRLGIAAEEIIKLADEMYADVVAMSTHGRSGIGRWAFGSVADRVLHEGNTPLLLVKPS